MKKKIYLICTTIIILLFQVLNTVTSKDTFVYERVNYLSAAGNKISSVAEKFSSWRQIYGSSYEDDENTGGAGHGSIEDLENRIDHHFTSGYGVNCSGFVRAVIYSATGLDVMHSGIYINDVISSGYFSEVSESEIQPGDIFWTTDGPSGHHIGIITEVIGYDGNGTATFHTAESDSSNWGRTITKYDYYSGAGPYKFIRFNREIGPVPDDKVINREGGLEQKDFTCDTLCDPNREEGEKCILDYISEAYIIIEIIAVALYIFMNIWMFTQAVASSEQDKFKKLGKKMVFRTVALVIVLLLPILIKAILSLLQLSGVEQVIGFCIEQFL